MIKKKKLLLPSLPFMLTKFPKHFKFIFDSNVCPSRHVPYCHGGKKATCILLLCESWDRTQVLGKWLCLRNQLFEIKMAFKLRAMR